MASALIVYGSTTGNTEAVAEQLESILKDAGHTTKVLNASDASAAGLCDGYDVVLFGCSTWGQDSIELQDDFIPIFDDFDKIGVSGKKAAAFGCGDSSYEYFCGAVDEIERKLNELGAKVLCAGLKIDGDVEEAEVAKWAKDVVAGI